MINTIQGFKMEILLARETITSKPINVKIAELKKNLSNTTDQLFYFDRDNSHKDMMSLIESFEDDNFTVHFREIKFGLEEDAYLYELHII
jgi:hypothetical protein